MESIPPEKKRVYRVRAGCAETDKLPQLCTSHARAAASIISAHRDPALLHQKDAQDFFRHEVTESA
jgi:hypothetical protein